MIAFTVNLEFTGESVRFSTASNIGKETLESASNGELMAFAVMCQRISEASRQVMRQSKEQCEFHKMGEMAACIVRAREQGKYGRN